MRGRVSVASFHTPAQLSLGSSWHCSKNTGITFTVSYKVEGAPLSRYRLTGKYDFHLCFFRPNRAETPAQFLPSGAEFLDTVRQPAPDVVTLADEQLGLTLKKGKISLDVLVIDHAEKTPADN